MAALSMTKENIQVNWGIGNESMNERRVTSGFGAAVVVGSGGYNAAWESWRF